MSYAAPAEHHPSDLPATCTYLGRDVEFISDAFSLSDDGTTPGTIVTALKDSLSVWPRSRGPAPNVSLPPPPPLPPPAVATTTTHAPPPHALPRHPHAHNHLASPNRLAMIGEKEPGGTG